MFDLGLLSILLPAFVAGILVLSTHVILGRQVLKRGIIFIDLAIAQVAALGAIVAHINHAFTHLPWVEVWMPALFALTGAVIISWLSQHMKHELEAIIGCIYVLAAVTGSLILANDPHGGELQKQLMSGQILWVNWQQLMLPAIISILFLVLIWFKPQWLMGNAFYILFALLITFSVELVGVYLVFSCLIIPALAVHTLQQHQLLFGYLIGVIGFIAGLIISATFDLPSGGSIVVMLALSALLFRFMERLKVTIKAKSS